MKRNEIISLVEHPGAIGAEHLGELKACVEQFPYSQTFRFLYLKGLKNVGDLRYDQELRKTSLYATDRSSLHQLILVEPETLVEETSAPVVVPTPVAEKKADLPTSQEQTGRPASAAATIADITDLLNDLKPIDDGAPVKQMRGQSLIDDSSPPVRWKMMRSPLKRRSPSNQRHCCQNLLKINRKTPLVSRRRWRKSTSSRRNLTRRLKYFAS